MYTLVLTMPLEKLPINMTKFSYLLLQMCQKMSNSIIVAEIFEHVFCVFTHVVISWWSQW